MKPISVLLVERLPERRDLILDALRAHGVEKITVIEDDYDLTARIAEAAPDLVLIDIENPSRDVLEELSLASSPTERPVAIFVDRSEHSLTRAAIEAGVSAYVVDGLRKDRIAPILDAAISRFHLFQRMRNELAATKAALEERKIVDRAKGIIMKIKNVDEDQAYAMMRKTAMDQKQRIVEIAQAVIATADLLR